MSISAKGASGSVQHRHPDRHPISTVSGRIHNNAESVGQPTEDADHVELRATTVSGDVIPTQQ